MNTDSTIVIGIMTAFCVIVGVAIKLGHRPQESIEEYSVGGRSLNWMLVCFSYMGGWYVGATYTGWFAWSADLGLFAQYLVVYSTTGLIIMYAMAKPVWTWGKEYGLETQADIIELRYGSTTFALFFALLTGLAGAAWLVIEMITLGYIVSAATNQVVSFNAGMLILGSAVIFYCLVGGARASSVGALVQGLTFTLLGTATFYILIVKAYGGVLPLMDLVEQNKPELLTLNVEKGLDLRWVSAILTGTFGAFCWPTIFSRMYMASSPRETKRAVYVAPIAALMIGIVVLWLGLGGRMLPGFPEDAQGGIFWMANQFGGPIALGLVGVFAASAAVSTISTNANGIAVLFAKNLIGIFADSETLVLKAAKVLTIVLGVVAMAIATLDLPQLITIALAMYDCVVQAIVPLLFGVYWKKGNLQGATAGMVVGITVALGSLIFPELIAWTGGVSGGLVGLAANAIVYVGCAFAFGNVSRTDELFAILKQYDDEGVKWS